jgi:hypothetical protein
VDVHVENLVPLVAVQGRDDCDIVCGNRRLKAVAIAVRADAAAAGPGLCWHGIVDNFGALVDDTTAQSMAAAMAKLVPAQVLSHRSSV